MQKQNDGAVITARKVPSARSGSARSLGDSYTARCVFIPRSEPGISADAPALNSRSTFKP